MTNSFNYKTYCLGTPRDIEESSSLVLLNSLEFGGEITLDSLKNISEEIKKKEKQIKRAAKSGDGSFIVDLSGDIFSFDTILYYNSGSGYIGFTLFSGLQNCYSSSGNPFKRIKIFIVFDRIHGKNSEFLVKIKNYLDPNVENTKILGSSERWEYPESKFIFGEEDPEVKNYLGFTNKISDYLKDEKLCMITDSGVMTNSGKIFGLNIVSGVDVDSDSFSTIRLVTYRGDIAVLKYSSQTGEYCVSSLSTLNAFHRLHDYISGTIENNPGELIGYTGQVLLFSDNEDYLIYPLENSGTQERYSKKENYVILDPLDVSGRVRYISGEDLKKEIIQSCPVPSDFKYNTYIYKSKYGCWWEFGISGKYLYTSVYGYIISNSRINFINSRIGMYQRGSKYHFFPIDYGHNYEVRNNGRVLDTASNNYCDIVINPSDSLSSLSPETRCFLDGLRRKPIRTSRCLPEEGVLGVGLGMIFYLSNGLLYCY